MTATPADDAAFRQRMAYDGDLGQMLCEYIWGLHRDIRLGDDAFEVVGGEDVPGYENDPDTVLLQRKSDGQVFEADLDVSLRAAQTPEQMDAALDRLQAAVSRGRPS